MASFLVRFPPFFQHYTPVTLSSSFRSLADLSISLGSDFPLPPTDIQEELRTWMEHPDACRSTPDTTAGEEPFKRIRRRSGVETQRCLIGATVVDSSDLPSHSSAFTSTITGQKICVSCLEFYQNFCHNVVVSEFFLCLFC